MRNVFIIAGRELAGYFATPDMDLIDLFIGSEGTLGVITTVTFRTLSPIPTSALAFVPRAWPIYPRWLASVGSAGGRRIAASCPKPSCGAWTTT